MNYEETMKRMQELVELLKKAAYAYEQENRELMSNFEYDKLYDELLKLEEETGTVLAGSVTQKVGYEVASNLKKVTHPSRMLSLDKTKEIEKLKSFLGNQLGMLSWKLDGLTIVCTYEEGKLIQAVTRGNGEIGEDVTNNARTFLNLPLTISYKERLVIRGEAVITYSDFERINEKLEGDDKYKNPRNLCSGSVRQLNSEITAKRNVRLYVFAVVEGDETCNSKMEKMEWLKGLGFEIVEYKAVTQENIEEAVAYFGDEVKKRDFASDGLVLVYDDIAYSKSLGTTAKFPKDGIAFKWQDEISETQIIAIEWNTSRTGLINPVAIFEPVELEGTTVERASLHNLSIVEDLKIGIGDQVTVFKANMIIPQIAENLTQSGPIEPPHECHVCGAETVIKQDKTAKTVYCPNGNCPAQRQQAFVHYASRDAMNIEGLSEATVEKFLAKGFLVDFASLYHLSDYEEEIKAMEGFGQKSYDKLISAIERTREVNLHQFIYALGILQVGPMNAKLICKHFENDLEAIQKATPEELVTIEGVGPVIAREMHDYFQLPINVEMLERLTKEIKFKQVEKVETSALTLEGKTFVITGDVNHFANRKALSNKIEELGGKVTGSVSKKTDYLINNDNTSASSKNKKAKELEIPILTEEDFLQMIQE
ncbi:NAD-dependent DNA ligase LigA [Niameybacter massiliensis]|uniref:DNA ligase n=1 Tax=Holtiella tumoricola TaxID=3018743 RepID=A0AA42IZN9_9FIRM|nr:NAD-dependent DNA ligase LigA [Holtiella tumoricola]MDA3730233.1 NAD-dependent DNA ligase LigA [Holtiella tumoricola]